MSARTFSLSSLRKASKKVIVGGGGWCIGHLPGQVSALHGIEKEETRSLDLVKMFNVSFISAVVVHRLHFNLPRYCQ